jgi:hypothetical protein
MNDAPLDAPPALASLRQGPRVTAPPLRSAPLATLIHDGSIHNSKRSRRQRRRMNERVRRRNARVVGRNDFAHYPWPDTCPTSMYVGGSKKGVQTATPRSHLVASDRTRSNLANLATLPVRHANRDEDAAFLRTSQDVTGHEGASAATSEDEALNSCQRRYQ